MRKNSLRKSEKTLKKDLTTTAKRGNIKVDKGNTQNKEDMKMKRCGFVKGTDIQIVELNGKRYALNGWNGEKYYDCYEVDIAGYAIDPKAAAIEMTPDYAEIGEDEFEITGYTIG